MIKCIANKILNNNGKVTYANKVLLALYLLEIIAIVSKKLKSLVDATDREIIAAEIFKDTDFVEQVYGYFKIDDFSSIGRLFDFKLTVITHARSSIFCQGVMDQSTLKQ
jgi:hypothetical protein